MSVARNIDLLRVGDESHQLHLTAHYDPCNKTNRVTCTFLSQKCGINGGLLVNKGIITMEWYVKDAPGWRYRNEFEVVRSGTYDVVFRNNFDFANQSCPNPFLQMGNMVLAVSAIRRAMRLFLANRFKPNDDTHESQFVQVEDVNEAKCCDVMSIHSDISSDLGSPVRGQEEITEGNIQVASSIPGLHHTNTNPLSETCDKTTELLHNLKVSGLEHPFSPPNPPTRTRINLSGHFAISDTTSVGDFRQESVLSPSLGKQTSTSSQTTSSSRCASPSIESRLPKPWNDIMPGLDPNPITLPPPSHDCNHLPDNTSDQVSTHAPAASLQGYEYRSEADLLPTPVTSAQQMSFTWNDGDLDIQDVELDNCSGSDDEMPDPDEYWNWDPKIEKFCHWDGQAQEIIYCPDEFD